jgi:hypothetical protein
MVAEAVKVVLAAVDLELGQGVEPPFELTL